jgi:hypothetical protein
VERFFGDSSSLFVRAYDVFYRQPSPPIVGARASDSALQTLLDHSEQTLFDAADLRAWQPVQRTFQYQHR